MKRFKNILTVLNGAPGEDRLIDRAVALAGANKAKLIFCSAPDENTILPALLESRAFYQDFARFQKQERKDRLEKAVNAAKSAGLSARSRLLEGPPFLEIIREVQTGKRDLVLFPDTENVSLRDRIFGSTALHLMRKCPCPVWVFKESATNTRKKGFKRVLAAVNAVANGEIEERLNIKILEMATSLAAREEAEIHVVHCWSVYGEAQLAARGRVSPGELAEYRSATRSSHRTALNMLLKRFVDEGHRIHRHMPKGDPGIQVPLMAEKHRADVLVMGTVSRTGIDGLLIGNTAERVLQRIGRSVLAVKPEGFVSPVTLEENGS